MKTYNQSIQNPVLNHTGLRTLSVKLVGDLKLDLVQGITDYITGKNQIKRSNLTESVIARYSKKLKFNKNALYFLHSDKSLPTFLRYSATERKLDLNSNQCIINQVNYKRDYKFAKQVLAPKSLQSLIDSLTADSVFFESTQHNKESYNMVQLVLEGVQCEKLTPGYGNDEIYVGGTKIYYQGQTMPIPELFVKNFNNRDRYKTFGYQIAQFPIEKNDPFPQMSSAILTLAEKDDEGFADFLEELLNATRRYVYNALIDAGVSIAVSVGGTILGPIGAIIGAIAAYLLLELVDLIVECFRDDIFKPQVVSINLSSAYTNFNGNINAPGQCLIYKGDDAHGGFYRVYYHWQVVRTQ